MDTLKRMRVLRAMDTMIRALNVVVNDEYWLDLWLMYGIGDGDADTDEGLEFYLEDKVYGDMMARFARIMRRATTDNVLFSEEDIENGDNIFFSDGVSSKIHEY